MKTSIFWDIPQCSLVRVYRRFVGTYSLASYLLHDGFFLDILLDLEHGDDMLPRNVG
jgi:hypothetical protein